MAERTVRVLLHLRDDELLIERAAVDADAHRPAIVDRDFADRRELLVAPLAGADVAGIDPVLVERSRTLRIFGQQQMAVVMEIADERRVAAGVEHALFDFWNRSRRFGNVHRHADHFRSGFGELEALLGRRARVARVGHRHRLHDDRRTAANLDAADAHTYGLVEPHN